MDQEEINSDTEYLSVKNTKNQFQRTEGDLRNIQESSKSQHNPQNLNHISQGSFMDVMEKIPGK